MYHHIRKHIKKFMEYYEKIDKYNLSYNTNLLCDPLFEKCDEFKDPVNIDLSSIMKYMIITLNNYKSNNVYTDTNMKGVIVLAYMIIKKPRSIYGYISKICFIISRYL